MKRDFPLISALYILACLAVMPYVKWYVDNPDSLQYISIANHIIEGRFTLAINGYWSPLITWLLTPFIIFFGDGIIAFKYLQMAIGIYVIARWLDFLKFMEIEIRWKRMIGFAIIPFMISYSLLNLTPDLLFLGLLLSLVIELILWLDKKTDGSRIGKLGGLLFLTKSFGLPVFVFLFGVTIWMKDERIPKSVLKKIAFPFIGMAGIWIILLSVKYGKFTVSESAKFNFTYEVAPTPGKTVQLPVLGNGLLPPANDHALSAWEEPASQVQLTTLDPIGDFSYYINVVNRNLQSIYFHDFRNQLGWVFVFFLVIYLLRKRSDESVPLWINISLLVICTLYFGYSLILVHERYIWICTLLFIPTTLFFMEQIFRSFKSFGPTTTSSAMAMIPSILMIAVLLLAVKRPVKEVLLCGDRNVNAIQLYHTIFSPVTALNTFYRPDIQLHNDIEKLKRIIPSSATFASLKDPAAERDGYAQALWIAYELKGKYLGQTYEPDSTFKGYLISYREEEGKEIYRTDRGIKVYLR